jgi:HSP20 family protein
MYTRNALRRDPMVDLLHRLEHRIGGNFNTPLRTFEWPGPETATATTWLPVVDIFEEPDHLRIVAEIPGVKPENVKIAVEDNVLTIQGTKEQVAEERAEKVHRYERTYGAFERSFTLPGTVNAEAIKANYEHGLLTLTLPKLEKAKARQIKVDITPAKALKA